MVKIKYAGTIFLLVLCILLVKVRPNELGIFNVYDEGDSFDCNPSCDELGMYAPMAKKAAQGHFGDPYIKEDADKIAVVMPQLFSLAIVSSLVKFFGLDITYVILFLIFGFFNMFLIFLFLNKLVKNERAALVGTIVMALFFNVITFIAYLPKLHVLGTLFRWDLVIFRFWNLMIPFTFLMLSLFLLKKLIFDDISIQKKICYTLLVAMNFYFYIYTWTLILAALGVLCVFVAAFKIWKLLKKIVLIGFSLVVLGLPQIIILFIKRSSFPNIERFLLVSGFHLPNLLLILFCLIILFILIRFFDAESTFFFKTETSYYFLALVFATAALVLSNINLIIPFPQPHHYNYYLHLFGSMVVFTTLYHHLKEKPIFKYAAVLFPLLVISLFSINVVYELNLDSHLEQGEYYSIYLDNLDGLEGEQILLTKDLKMNMLIPSKTDHFVFIPNAFHFQGSFNETLERLYVLESFYNITIPINERNRWNMYLFHVDDYGNIYKGAPFIKPNRTTITPTKDYIFDYGLQ